MVEPRCQHTNTPKRSELALIRLPLTSRGRPTDCRQEAVEVSLAIFQRRQYQARSDRQEYLLTKKGQAPAPVTATVRAWVRIGPRGRGHSPRLTDDGCGHETTTTAYCQQSPRRRHPRRGHTRAGRGPGHAAGLHA